MGKVKHDPVAIGQPIDRSVTVIRWATEGLSFPDYVAERDVGSARLHQIEVAFARISGPAIGGELEIGAVVASAGLAPHRRKTEKGEVGGSRKDVEGKAQLCLTAKRCHRCGQQKPGDERDQGLAGRALKEAHGAKCSGNRQASQPSPLAKKKSPGAGIAEARTHYTESTTTQTRYYRARIECLEPMAVLRRILVDLAFNNKDLAVSPHPQWLVFRCPYRPLKAPLALVGKPVPCRMDGYFRHVRQQVSR